MIIGARRWMNPSTYYNQRNDLLEEIRRKLGDKHILQSCGPNAACSCMEAVGHDLTVLTPGGYSIPPDDLLTEWLNNPRNYRAMHDLGIDPTLEPNNRHAPFYPLAVKALWHITAVHLVHFGWRHLIPLLRHERAVQICINPPGHYLAAVAYDMATEEVIANDPWADRPRTPAMHGTGFNIRLTNAERDSIVSEAVVYYPREM